MPPQNDNKQVETFMPINPFPEGASRREALRSMGLAGLAALLGPGLMPALARAADAAAQPGFSAVSHPFSPAQMAFIAAYSERIVPKTDTPGAVEAGVPAFIEMMVGDWFHTDERAAFIAGITAMEAYSQTTYRKAFAKLKPADQDATITALMNGGIPAAGPFFDQSRQLILAGYYSSEIGETVERVYLPVPGDYDGAYDYAKVKRVFNG